MKVELSPPQNKGYESPLKMMRNHFHFILKALFVFQIFMFFVLTFWLCKKERLEKKVMAKKVMRRTFMTSRTGQQIITIHILPNISRRQTDNETWSVNRV